MDIKSSMTPDTNLIDNERSDAPQNGTVVTKENISDPAKDYGISLPNQGTNKRIPFPLLFLFIK